MKRVTSTPRADWKQQIESQGLVYSDGVDSHGNRIHYWNEYARYEFTLDEVDHLEHVSEKLHAMTLEAAHFLVAENRKNDTPFKLGISRDAVELAAASLERGDKSLYGRFDLVWEDFNHGPAKMLEYNADTPTGLVEAAICQWYWFTQTYQEFGYDQWNGIHEALVDRWTTLKNAGSFDTVHFGWTSDDHSGEDLMTTTYLRETAIQAGLTTIGLEMRQIGLEQETQRFVGRDNEYIGAFFKLYPWEDMMDEGFGQVVSRTNPRNWFEPAWKMLLSNKVLSAAMWEIFPGHENLLPTYVDGPRDLSEWVRKPLFGREGANVYIHTSKGDTAAPDPRWGQEGYVWQQYHELPDFTDKSNHPSRHNRAILGTWMIGDECYGVGIRESDSLVTDSQCRFVPNVILPLSTGDLWRNVG